MTSLSTHLILLYRDERHARLQKKARPHENDDDEGGEEEEDLNDANYDEVNLSIYIYLSMYLHT